MVEPRLKTIADTILDFYLETGLYWGTFKLANQLAVDRHLEGMTRRSIWFFADKSQLYYDMDHEYFKVVAREVKT